MSTSPLCLLFFGRSDCAPGSFLASPACHWLHHAIQTPHALRGGIHLTPQLSFMQISSLSPIAHPSLRRAAQGLSRVVVGLCMTKSTASVNLLGDDRTRTLARVEAAAAVSAIGVAGARTCDKLRSSSLASAAGGGRCLGGDGGSGSGRLGRRFAE